jgi:hypothetical protein
VTWTKDPRKWDSVSELATGVLLIFVIVSVIISMLKHSYKTDIAMSVSINVYSPLDSTFMLARSPFSTLLFLVG